LLKVAFCTVSKFSAKLSFFRRSLAKSYKCAVRFCWALFRKISKSPPKIRPTEFLNTDIFVTVHSVPIFCRLIEIHWTQCWLPFKNSRCDAGGDFLYFTCFKYGYSEGAVSNMCSTDTIFLCFVLLVSGLGAGERATFPSSVEQMRRSVSRVYQYSTHIHSCPALGQGEERGRNTAGVIDTDSVVIMFIISYHGNLSSPPPPTSWPPTQRIVFAKNSPAAGQVRSWWT
jgi:hypothetical protein